MTFSLDNPALQALAWTLLHFLWQGALLGLLAKAGLWLLRGRSPQARYLLGCAALAAMAAAPVATFLLLKPTVLASSGTVLIEASRAVAAGAVAREASPFAWARELSLAARPLLPWAVGLWMTGVSILSLRLVGGWFWLLRLRTRLAEPAGACWQMTLNGIARRMKVNMDVRILRSWAVDTLMVVGWVKPLVLVPAAALAGLSPEALEAVLAHELEHVRRHDYLVNLIQSVLEVLLFYHPAVWWISAQIRQERELCCDDAAVALCGDPILYARALAALEGLRGDPLPATRLAPAAHGGTLMNRIQRLLSPTLPPSPTRRAGVLAALAVTALGAGTVFRMQEPPKKPEAGTEKAEAKRARMNIQIHEDGSRLRVKSQGDVKVRPDAKTDLALADGASFELSESDKDSVRRFSATREKGAEKRTFTVNGKEAQVDQAWLDQRLDKLKKMEQKAAEAQAKAKTAEGKAKDAEEKAHRIEVRVRKLGKDGKEIISEDVHELPGEGSGHKRIILKKHGGEGLAEIEELHGPGKVMVFKGGDGKVFKLDSRSSDGKVIVLEGPDAKKIKIDVERIAKDASAHARAIKLHGKDLEGLHDRLKLINPELDFDFDFDFDDGDAPRAFRWDMKTPGPEHRERIKELQKHGQQKEVEVLRREIERLQQRLDRLQERMHQDGPPAAAPRAPRPPKPPTATPKPSAVPAPPAAPKAPPATPAPAAPPRPPAPPPAPAPGAEI